MQKNIATSFLTKYIFENPHFLNAYNNAAANERLANFQIVGGWIARINGYVEDREVSRKSGSKEKKRNVYFNKASKQYLSIDYEKGAFEVHDQKGSHLFEINFYGQKINGRDDEGRHDLTL